ASRGYVDHVVKGAARILEHPSHHSSSIGRNKIQATDGRRRCQPGSDAVTLSVESQLRMVDRLSTNVFALRNQILQVSKAALLECKLALFILIVSPALHLLQVRCKQQSGTVGVCPLQALSKWSCCKASATMIELRVEILQRHEIRRG